jgi:hypothetical protein
MQRSKQQALMFLLGALLVGGVLGFSADRVIAAKTSPRPMERRISFYDRFSITPDQRKKLDSIFDDTNCKIDAVMTPIRPSLDSIKNAGRVDWLAVMTEEQRKAIAAHEAKMKAQRDSVRAARASAPRSEDRPRRCGGNASPVQGPGVGGGGGGGPRGPGGPHFF